MTGFQEGPRRGVDGRNVIVPAPAGFSYGRK